MSTGYNTYIIAAVVIVLGVMKSQGWIDNETLATVLTILGGAGLITLRAGVKKDTDK